jgi:hypothetical protein
MSNAVHLSPPSAPPAARAPAAGWVRPFVHVFAPFALLLAAGNLYAELQPNLTLARVVVSIWVTFALAAPAVVLFGLADPRSAPRPIFRYWRLCWAFGLVAFAIHTYYAVVVWFGWDFSQIADRQGLTVTVVNFTLLAVWAIDIAVALARGQGGGRVVAGVRWAAHLLFVVAAFVSAVTFTKSAVAMALAWVIAAGFLLALACRATAWLTRPRPVPRPLGG